MSTYKSGSRKHILYNFLPFLFDNWNLKGFDKGLITDMILIDLQKAFDTIGHGVI